jgi:hypothetical protein
VEASRFRVSIETCAYQLLRAAVAGNAVHNRSVASCSVQACLPGSIQVWVSSKPPDPNKKDHDRQTNDRMTEGQINEDMHGVFHNASKRHHHTPIDRQSILPPIVSIYSATSLTLSAVIAAPAMNRPQIATIRARRHRIHVRDNNYSSGR